MSCPVCFNAAIADDSVRTSINAGLGVLLAVTAVVLAGFLRFIVSIARHARDTDVVRTSVVSTDLHAGSHS
jgi:hypothetical protein